MTAPRWVGQEDAWGCGIAAVAMLTGKTYQEARARFGKASRMDEGAQWRMSGDDYLHALSEQGYAYAKLWWARQMDYENEQRAIWPPEPWSDVHIAEVIAGNQGSHMVVMLEDGAVLDPLTPTPKRLTDYLAVHWVAAVTPLPCRCDPPGSGEEGCNGACEVKADQRRALEMATEIHGEHNQRGSDGPCDCNICRLYDLWTAPIVTGSGQASERITDRRA